MLWYTAWLGEIQAWGKGSLQLEDPDNEQPIDPMQHGRRLPDAEEYITAQLKRGLDEANGWSESRWGCSADELRELQVCVRMTYVLAWKRHSYVSRLPWLLARLFQPGIRDRCVDQWEDFQHHHMITQQILDPSNPLRADVDKLHDDGSNASPALRVAVAKVQNIPFDDSIAESPHSLANGVARGAQRCNFPWIASSLRLHQNLRDHQLWSSALDAHIQDEWLVLYS